MIEWSKAEKELDDYSTKMVGADGKLGLLSLFKPEYEPLNTSDQMKEKFIG